MVKERGKNLTFNYYYFFYDFSSLESLNMLYFYTDLF
jgi:hypothetical protein